MPLQSLEIHVSEILFLNLLYIIFIQAQTNLLGDYVLIISPIFRATLSSTPEINATNAVAAQKIIAMTDIIVRNSNIIRLLVIGCEIFHSLLLNYLYHRLAFFVTTFTTL